MGNYRTLKSFEIKRLLNSILKLCIDTSIFNSFILHAVEIAPLNNHIYMFTICIASHYLQLRFYYVIKLFSSSLHERKGFSRQVSNKLAIFSGL